MLIDERARVHFADLVAVGANDRYFSSNARARGGKSAARRGGIPRVTVAIMQNVVR